MKPTRLILIPAVASQPAPYLVVSPDGYILHRGTLTLDGTDQPQPMRTVAVTPGADVMIRWLDLPTGSVVQMRAAAAWSLRDDVAATPERLATILGPSAGAGQLRLTAVVSRALLEAWTDYLRALGVNADVLVPDVLTLSEPDADDEVLAVSFGNSVALRGRRFAATVQPELVELIAADRRVVAVEDSDAVERALIAAALAPAINLLETGDREHRTASGSWRRAAALAGLVLVSPLLLTAAAAARDDMAARQMRAEALAAIAVAAPDLARTADPVAAFRQRVAAAPPPGGVTAAAAALFVAVESVEGAELDILIADPETGVKATVSHPAYSDMARIQSAMADAGMLVTETGTLDDAGRVVSDITIGAAR